MRNCSKCKHLIDKSVKESFDFGFEYDSTKKYCDELNMVISDTEQEASEYVCDKFEERNSKRMAEEANFRKVENKWLTE